MVLFCQEGEKMKSIYKYLIIILVILLASASAAYLYYQKNLQAPSDVDEEIKVEFSVEKGATPANIAKNLKEEGLIKDEQTFLTYVKINKLTPQLKAGQYLLLNTMSVEEITDIIIKGVSIQKKFTIPEGYTIWQIAEVMEREGIMSEEVFWQLAIEEDFPEYEFIAGLKKDKHRLEGYLFPETYYISRQEEPRKVFQIMINQFLKVKARLPENKSGLSERNALILASIVEAESMAAKERPLIASVFLNRLDLKMKLECDATIQYALGKRKEIVLFKDLEIDSPYNTYRNTGLTPTPICAVGESALKAVYQPDQSDYLFFFAKNDGSGEHVFNKSYAEHERQMRDWGYRQ